MKAFCKHEWEILSEVTTESKMEHFAKVTKMEHFAKVTSRYQPPANFFQYEAMTARKHITTVTCKKCGGLKRFVEEI